MYRRQYAHIGTEITLIAQQLLQGLGGGFKKVLGAPLTIELPHLIQLMGQGKHHMKVIALQ